MDTFTETNKCMLEKVFSSFNKEGIYVPHQHIYGYGKDLDDTLPIFRYYEMYWLIKTLSGLRFNSFLDVGGAEGFYPYLVRKFFNSKVRNSDLSEEACKRSKEILNIDSDCADAHKLPYKNEAFDIVFCNDSLAHVSNLEVAVEELFRVAKKAVIIMVPREPKEATEYIRRIKVVHEHINNFDIGSFDYLKERGYEVRAEKAENVLLFLPDKFINAYEIGYYIGRYPRWIFTIYNSLLFLIKNRLVKWTVRTVFASKTVAGLMLDADSTLSKILPFHLIYITILKDKSIVKGNGSSIKPLDILNTGVPYYKVTK